MRCTFLLLLVATSCPLLAQPPVNTTCQTAVALPVSGTNVQSGFLYIDSNNFPNVAPAPVTTCSGSNPKRIGWFKFTAINSTHWLRTEGANVYGHALEVLSGTCGSLTSIQCIQSGDPYQALTGLTAGEVYYVRVFTSFFCTPSDGNCQLGLAVVSAPTNDECGGATELVVRGSALTVNPATEIASIGCTQSLAECTGAPGSADDDCWFRFTATGTVHHFPYTLLHSGTPTIQWYSGSCGSLTGLACNSRQATNLTPGQQYYIRLHSAVNDPEQQLRLLGDVCANAPNDECSGATPIAVAHSGEEAERIRVSLVLGTSSVVPCGTTTIDTWLSFTAPSTSVAVVADAYCAVALFSGSCGALVCKGTDNLDPISSPAKVFNALTVGDTYFLKVGYHSASRDDVGIRVFAAPTNDECGTATPLSVLPHGQGEGFVHGSTAAATAGSSTCDASVADVWYSFTATADRHLISIESEHPNAGIDLEVLSGACGSLTSVFCATSNQDYMPTLVSGLVPGTSYRVRVYTATYADPGFFRIAVIQGVPNDECAGAIELLAQPLAAYGTLGQSWTHEATPGTSTCAPTNKDVWYRFTPVGTTATFLAIRGSATGFPGSAELFSGICGSLSSMSCTDLTTNARARFTGLTPGTEYFVRLAGTATYVPMIVQAPLNDEITGAIVAPFASAFTPPSGIGHGYGATQSLPTTCNGTPDDDTWYRFTATATSHTVRALQSNFQFSETALFFGLQIQVFDTLTTDMAVLAAHSIGCGNNGTASVNGLTVGDDYWYRVYAPDVAPAEVCMFATWIQGESSDEPAGAIELPYGQSYSHAFNTTGATQTLPGADCSTEDFADDDIWFKFTATASPARVVAGYGTADLTLELFSGTPGNLTSVVCGDNVLVLPTLTTGQTYYLRLYSWKNSTPVQGRIGLLFTPSLTANDCVDEQCLGPVLLPNPGIEQDGYCQTGTVSVADIVGLGVPLAPGWPRVGIGSSDAYGSCTLFEKSGEMPGSGLTAGDRTISRSGNGMAGMLLSDFGDATYREYISAPLSAPLVPGEPYLVSFSTTAASGNAMFTNGIGAYLSEGIVAQHGYQAIPVQPQIMAHEVIGPGPWTTICGIVVPDAPWDHITVGSFFQHAEEYTYQGIYGARPYYFIDDVVVARIDDPSCITAIGDVPPLDEDANSGGDNLRVYPNPANDRLNIVGDVGLFGERAVIEVFDITGKRMHAEEVAWMQALQPLHLPADWKEGLYLVMVRVEGKAPRSARVVLRR